MKKITALTLAVLLVLGVLPMTGLTGLQSEAKTIASAKGENIFLYAEDTSGKPVLFPMIQKERI